MSGTDSPAVPDTDRVVHVAVGPDRHGVVRHAAEIAGACGQPLVRLDQQDASDPNILVDRVSAAPVVHIAYTDRLFADTCELSGERFTRLAAALRAAGSAISVTLHDLPAGSSPLEVRRRAAYGQVVAAADGIVVNSARELQLLAEMSDRARSVRCIPLPVDRAAPGGRPAPVDSTVAVLGFLYPDRGYEHTLAELPAGVGLVALGEPSAGHDDLPAALERVAAAAGRRITVTGFVPDAELPARLRSAGVPVAPNRRVAASASIAAWLGQGRRPLAPETPYTRELAARWPGTLRLYDPDRPGALRSAIEDALADPGVTWIDADVTTGQTLAEAADAYLRHFAGCRPQTAMPVGRDKWVVPGNRWDLLDDYRPADLPSVSVVVPYYQAQSDLDLVLTGLALQDFPRSRLQVVVADDGSAAPPRLDAAGPLDVRYVRQNDRGFRAAAARNLGAAAADGEVLLFLDGDTVPAPGYVAGMATKPAVLPDALVVGRRRHADLTGWTPDRLRRWLTAGGDEPAELTEPGWLRDGYAATHELLKADGGSYRFVISAVLGMSRRLFEEIGGFSELFSSYGGEDWELAHRAWTAGAVLAHVPGAIAWHNGPDWSGRAAAVSTGAKNAETLVLSGLIPDPVARGAGQWWRYPSILVSMPGDFPAAVLASARSAFATGVDCGIWLTGGQASATAAKLDDPRIRSGAPNAEQRSRASAIVELAAPAPLSGLTALVAATAGGGAVDIPAGRIVPVRAAARAARWSADLGQHPDLLAARLFGGRDLPEPLPFVDIDLAHELKYAGQPVSRS